MSGVRESSTDNYWTGVMDKALEADSPVIQWFNRGNGVREGVVVYDPHAERGHNRTKTACKRDHPFTEDNTIITRDGRQCRTCKNERRRAG